MNPQPTPEQQEDFEDVRLFNAMTAFFTLSKRPWLFGLASLVLTMLSSIWFAICFTAREQAWWNSIYWFLLFYATAAILALRGIRSVMGIVALLFAIVPLALLGIFLFVL